MVSTYRGENGIYCIYYTDSNVSVKQTLFINAKTFVIIGGRLLGRMTLDDGILFFLIYL